MVKIFFGNFVHFERFFWTPQSDVLKAEFTTSSCPKVQTTNKKKLNEKWSEIVGQLYKGAFLLPHCYRLPTHIYKVCSLATVGNPFKRGFTLG